MTTGREGGQHLGVFPSTTYTPSSCYSALVRALLLVVAVAVAVGLSGADLVRLVRRHDHRRQEDGGANGNSSSCLVHVIAGLAWGVCFLLGKGLGLGKAQRESR